MVQIYPNPNSITWKEFHRAFDDNYLPRIYKDTKIKEFLNLTQGIIMVEHYKHYFIELPWYASHFIRDDKDKCDRFIDGLKGNIKMIMVSQEHTNFNKIL